MTASTATAPAPDITREAWLARAVIELAPRYAVELPPVKVSVGWPGGRANRTRTMGQCWPPGASADNIGQIFISPVIDDTIEVLATLVHELVHAINHRVGSRGHGAGFVRIATAIGLEGKPTATHAGAELEVELKAVAARIGAYPHSRLTPGLSGVKVQGTRMIKCVCPGPRCGYTVRLTRKWLTHPGAPICPSCRVQLEESV